MPEARSKATISSKIAVLASACALVVVGSWSAGCGGADTSAAVADASASAPGATPAAKTAASSGIQAAKAVGSVDTQYFTGVLPEGWEVMADDIDRMGLMTLAEKGSGGAQGVYFKFEKGFSGDPMKNIEKMASKYQGSTAESVTRNGIEWARTSYTYNGITQSLNIAGHNGMKVTLTVMGRDYDEDPGVKAVFDALELKS